MCEKRYICRDCKKTYKTLTWFNKHIIKKNHNPAPLDMFDLETIENLLMDKLENRFKKLELDTNFMKTQINNSVNVANTQIIYQNIPIERIKPQEPKITETNIYHQLFANCVKDLKEVLKQGMGYLKPQENYEPETTEEMAIKKLKEINAKNKRKELDISQLRLVRK